MNLYEKCLHRKIVYQGKYVRTEEQTVLLPDGTETIREIVSPPDAVGIFALGPNEEVYLVRQYRPAIGQITLEIPAGIIDPGERPSDTAKRECAEETGWMPGKLQHFMSYYHSVGFSTGKIDLFLGKELVSMPTVHLDAGEFIERVTLPFDTLYQQAIEGLIIDSKTLLAAFWYQQNRPHLKL